MCERPLLGAGREESWILSPDGFVEARIVDPRASEEIETRMKTGGGLDDCCLADQCPSQDLVEARAFFPRLSPQGAIDGLGYVPHGVL
jgi:hypothetical protein